MDQVFPLKNLMGLLFGQRMSCLTLGGAPIYLNVQPLRRNEQIMVLNGSGGLTRIIWVMVITHGSLEYIHILRLLI